MPWPSFIISIGGRLKDDYARLNTYFASMKSTYDSHIAGTADKHAAEKITYSGSFINKQDVKAALDQAKAEINTIVINASIDPEVAIARESSAKEKSFDTLGDRLEEAEEDHKTHAPRAMPLKDENGVAFGDSITWSQVPGGQSAHPWPAVLAELAGCTIDNKGIGGTCLCAGVGTGMPPGINDFAFCNRIDNEDLSVYKRLYLMYLTNDFGYGFELGFDKDSFDKTTVRGAANYSFRKLAQDYPLLEVVVMTPMYAAETATKNNWRGYTMTDYIEVMKDVASQYGIPIIDLHHGMGINEYNIADYYWDALHPTEATYALMAKYIYRSMPSIAAVNRDTIKRLLPASGGVNLIKYGDFPSNAYLGVFADIKKERGATCKLVPASQLYQTSELYTVFPFQKLTLTHWCNSNLAGQYYEIDLFKDTVGALVTIPCYTKAGEHFVESHFFIPGTVSTATKYRLRISTSGLVSDKYIAISSLMLTEGDIPQKWQPAPGDKIGYGENALICTSQQIEVTRDTSVTGVQTIATNFRPKTILIEAIVPASKKWSRGQFGNNQAQHVTYQRHDTQNLASAGAMILLMLNDASYALATVQNISDNGFELNWTKVGAGEGVATLEILVQ